MTITEVEEEWGALTVLFPADGASGASIASAPLCEGAVRGIAGFWAFPPVDETDSWKQGTLFWLWLVSGVETEEHIGIGSRMKEVRNAYGDQLKRVLDDPVESADFRTVGYMDNLFEVAREGRTTLLVGLRNGRVVALGHAFRNEQDRLFQGLKILDLRC